MYEWHKDINVMLGTTRRSWLRHCATSGKVAVSIPYGVIGVFHSRNHYGHTMFLESTQTITKINISGISWGGKGVRWLELTNFPHSCADCQRILGATAFGSPQGLSRPAMGFH